MMIQGGHFSIQDLTWKGPDLWSRPGRPSPTLIGEKGREAVIKLNVDFDAEGLAERIHAALQSASRANGGLFRT